MQAPAENEDKDDSVYATEGEAEGRKRNSELSGSLLSSIKEEANSQSQVSWTILLQELLTTAAHTSRFSQSCCLHHLPTTIMSIPSLTGDLPSVFKAQHCFELRMSFTFTGWELCSHVVYAVCRRRLDVSE